MSVVLPVLTNISYARVVNTGKTTLMDCIAGRKTVGHITGNITVNGHPKDQRTWARVMGWVSVCVRARHGVGVCALTPFAVQAFARSLPLLCTCLKVYRESA